MKTMIDYLKARIDKNMQFAHRNSAMSADGRYLLTALKFQNTIQYRFLDTHFPNDIEQWVEPVEIPYSLS